MLLIVLKIFLMLHDKIYQNLKLLSYINKNKSAKCFQMITN